MLPQENRRRGTFVLAAISFLACLLIWASFSDAGSLAPPGTSSVHVVVAPSLSAHASSETGSVPTRPTTHGNVRVDRSSPSKAPPAPTPTSTATAAPTSTSTASAPPPAPRALSILSTDFHISPIADLKDIIKNHAQYVSIKDLSLSGACGRMGTCARPEELKVLRQGGWEQGIYATSGYKREFFNAYANGGDPFVSSFDTVICMHPTGMCEFYMPFNLSMIIWSTTRFEQGRESDPVKLAAFVKNFRAIAARPGNVVLANNLYDQHYVHYFTGIMPKYVPSLCTYPAVTYTWKAADPGRKRHVLVHGFRPRKAFSDSNLGLFLDPLNKAAENAGLPFDFVGFRDALGGNYAYSDLASYPALLYLPYQVSVMSFYEQYRMGIPIAAPSLELLTSWHLDYLLVSERTWDTALANAPRRGSAIPRHPDASDELFDPNDEFSREAVRYWLGFSDYYHFPHVILFDNWAELVRKLSSIDLEQVSRDMLAWSKEQEAQVVRDWQGILGGMPRAADRPQLSGTYEQRLNAIYGQGGWADY